MEKRWYVYMLRCRDGTLYTGITDDLQRRVEQHNTGKGAKYTHGRAPVTLVYYESAETKGEALRREIAIKRLTRPEKLAMIQAMEKA